MTTDQTTAAGSAGFVHRTVDSPVGPLLLAATDDGVVRVAFASEGFDDVLADLGRAVEGQTTERTAETLEEAERQLAQYFAGDRRAFDVPLDHRLSTGFRQQVQKHLATIPWGETRTYGQLAEAIGNGQAVRAVGTACATNPLPVLLPCHRVLRSDGCLGGYLGGLEAKETLLALEGAR